CLGSNPSEAAILVVLTHCVRACQCVLTSLIASTLQFLSFTACYAGPCTLCIVRLDCVRLFVRSPATARRSAASPLQPPSAMQSGPRRRRALAESGCDPDFLPRMRVDPILRQVSVQTPPNRMEICLAALSVLVCDPCALQQCPESPNGRNFLAS